jgi:hypothetical protein
MKYQLRREMRREAIHFFRENPKASDEQLEEHLKDEFSGIGIDPATLITLISLVIQFIRLFIKIAP